MTSRLLIPLLFLALLAGACAGPAEDTTAAAVATVTETVVETETATETGEAPTAVPSIEEGEIGVSEPEGPSGVPGDVTVIPAGGTLGLPGFDARIAEWADRGPGAAVAYDDYGTATNATPQGKYVLVRMEYTNTGNTPAQIGSVVEQTRLVDTAGREYNADQRVSEGLTYEANPNGYFADVNPGQTTTVRYAYDIPADATAQAAHILAGPAGGQLTLGPPS